MVKTPTTQQGQRHGEHGLLLPLPVGRRNCNRWSVFKKLTGVLLFDCFCLATWGVLSNENQDLFLSLPGWRALHCFFEAQLLPYMN